jgi:nucleoside-diphosphate-sugar epimerase
MRFDLAINVMTKDAVIDKKIVVSGGEQFRPFLSVNNAANSIMKALEYRGSLLCNVAEFNTTIIDLAKYIQGKFPYQVDIETQPDGLDNRNYKMSTEVMKRVLGLELEDYSNEIPIMASWIMDNKYKLDNVEFYTIRAWKKFLSGGVF